MVTDAKARLDEFTNGIAARESRLAELVEQVETQTRALAETNARIRQAKDDHLAMLALHAAKAQDSLQAAKESCREVERASQRRIAETERQHSIRIAAAEEDSKNRRDALKQEEERLNATLGDLRREIETLRAKFA
jgi:DNA repair exonuclease SbcCD ATPase subunit